MPLTTINDIFGGAWGIVEKRRGEIEEGSYGAFERVYNEEVASNFLPVTKVAELMDCHESTARNWLLKVAARYIVQGNGHHFLELDVAKAKKLRASHLAKVEEKRKTKGASRDTR